MNQSGDRFDAQGRLVPYLAPQPWSYSTGISSTVNLFDGGRRLNEVRRSRSDVGAAEANEVTQQFNVALQVKTQYYSILAARESEAAARAQLEQAQEQLKASIARTRAGVATLSDSLRSVVAVGNAQLALITARNNVRVASAALTRLVGSRDARDRAALRHARSGASRRSTAPRSPGCSIEGPTVRQAEAQLNSAQTSVRSARTPYLPTVDLTYSRSGNGFDKYYGIGSQSLAYTNNFAIRLAYPLFNNYQREDALNRARVQADVADAAVRDARLGGAADLRAAARRAAHRAAAHRPPAGIRRRRDVKTSACSSSGTRSARPPCSISSPHRARSTPRAPRSSRHGRTSASPARSSKHSSAASSSDLLFPASRAQAPHPRRACSSSPLPARARRTRS